MSATSIRIWVEQIKDAISKNQLPIDTGKIADGLIDSVRSFLKMS